MAPLPHRPLTTAMAMAHLSFRVRDPTLVAKALATSARRACGQAGRQSITNIHCHLPSSGTATIDPALLAVATHVLLALPVLHAPSGTQVQLRFLVWALSMFTRIP